jgi:ADP-ribosylglycohydrolase
MTTQTEPDVQSRTHGMLLGEFIADALAMPVHWYYNREALRRDYGTVTDYVAPRNPHPDSILHRSHYEAPNPKGEILHDQARFWGRQDVHYHQFLEPGENTLNLKTVRLSIDSLNERGGYDADDYLRRYIDFMTAPDSHRDTYVEEYHRAFFTRYANGHDPHDCGVEEKHIGGLAGIPPIVGFYRDAPDRGRQAALEHMHLTHRGESMDDAATLLIGLLYDLLSGAPLAETLERRIDRQDSRFLGHPYRDWLGMPDEWVLGNEISIACYLDHAMPAVIYLALKYADDPEGALVTNTNVGGDNCYRGAVLGALLGAAHGEEGFPGRWVSGLKEGYGIDFRR